MNRKEFMERLEKLLADISESERREAIQYYNDYFDDAGAENERRVIEELGSPEQVAQKIRAGMSDTASEYSERGYRDTRFERREGELASGKPDPAKTGAGRSQSRRQESNFWKIIALVLLCILLLPVLLPVGAGLLAAVLGVAAALLALVVGVLTAGFAVLIAGIAVIGAGIGRAFLMPAVGIALAGTGCLLTALGILLSLLTVWCCARVIPWLIRGVVQLICRLSGKAGERA